MGLAHCTVLKHLGPAFVTREISRIFYWPNMRRDIRNFCSDCPQCAQVRATRPSARALYRAQPALEPRSLLFMDLMSAGKSKCGKTQILVFVDAFSSAMELAALPDRSAASVSQAFLDRIIFRFGCPKACFTDMGKELIGEVMQKIMKTFGIISLATRGYNPSANGAAERAVKYVNRCMRLMTDECYTEWPLQLQSMAFAWNVAMRPDTGSSPFQINHGFCARMPAGTPSTALTDKDLSAGCLPSTAVVQQYANALQKNIEIFQEIARQARNFRRSETAAALNRRGSPRSFEVGQRCVFYRPCVKPVEGRRARHSIEWLPGIIVRKLGDSGLEIRDEDTKILYQRHYCNVNHCTSTQPLPGRREDPGMTVGTIFAFPAWPEDMNRATLARVTAIEDSTVHDDLFACTGRTWKQAVFKKVFVDDKGVLMLKPLDYAKTLRNHEPWAASANQEVVNELKASNLQLTSGSKLTADSLRRVEAAGLVLNLF